MWLWAQRRRSSFDKGEFTKLITNAIQVILNEIANDFLIICIYIYDIHAEIWYDKPECVADTLLRVCISIHIYRGMKIRHEVNSIHWNASLKIFNVRNIHKREFTWQATKRWFISDSVVVLLTSFFFFFQSVQVFVFGVCFFGVRLTLSTPFKPSWTVEWRGIHPNSHYFHVIITDLNSNVISICSIS